MAVNGNADPLNRHARVKRQKLTLPPHNNEEVTGEGHRIDQHRESGEHDNADL
jgi:hypothetical protein